MKKVLQQGDIIRIAFDPSLGQEQQGVRPALGSQRSASERSF